YLGHMMEVAPASLLFANPLHPYTQALLSAVPAVGRPARSDGRIRLEGEIPTPIHIAARGRFASRCLRAGARSWKEVAPLEPVGRDHFVKCFNFAPLDRAREQ